VALLGAQEGELHQQHDQADSSSNKPLHYSASVAHTAIQSSTCLGLGIIRSIDSSTSSYQILSPLPPDHLERVNALQKGEIELPTVLMVDYTDGDQDEGVCGTEWTRVPYLERRGDTLQSVGSGRRRVRRNVMRRSQMH
jgi:polynucleotide 5'-hydroxyl-kinase GRC3/NOL9